MSTVKVAAVSDLHGNLSFAVPQCDILAIAGDLCPVRESHHPKHQQRWLDRTFYPWCAKQLTSGVGNIVFTPGNHDFVFERPHTPAVPERVTCLIDSETTVCGLRIYGTPWTPLFGAWAFMTWESRLKEKFSRIPNGLDILLSHGPAYGLCDKILMPAWAGCSDGNLGSTELRAAVERAKPAWLFCGHIHSGEHSAVECGPTKAVNVSLVDEKYFKAYGVFTAELEGKEQC